MYFGSENLYFGWLMDDGARIWLIMRAMKYADKYCEKN